MRETDLTTGKSEDFKDYKEAILDLTRFKDGEKVEGLVLVKKIVETFTANTFKPILKIYSIGRDGASIQCNCLMYTKLTTTSEDIQRFVNKIIWVEGTVSRFKSFLILDLDESPVEPNLDGLTVDDFYSKIEDLKEQLILLERIKEHIKESERYGTLLDSFCSKGGLSLLSRLKFDFQYSKIGDGLVLANLILGQSNNLMRTLNKEDRARYMYLIITFISIYLKTKRDKVNMNGMLPKEKTYEILLMQGSIKSFNVFESDKDLNSEFLHIMESVILDGEPLTLPAKILKNSLNSCEEMLKSIRYEERTVKKNEININGERHIRM